MTDGVLAAVWSHLLPAATAVVGWAAGFFTDLGKERWKRLDRLRDDHARQIQKEILTPIYEYLNGFYLPVCQRQKVPPLDIASETIKRQPSTITERSDDHAVFKIVARHPHQVIPKSIPGYEYWRETEGFRRYFDDARRNHYPDLLGRWEAFLARFDRMRENAVTVASRLCVDLKSELGMPPRLAWGMGVQQPPWVNYESLALLIFNRHLGFQWMGLHADGSVMSTFEV